jgi:hypothetical protein
MVLAKNKNWKCKKKVFRRQDSTLSKLDILGLTVTKILREFAEELLSISYQGRNEEGASQLKITS